MFLAGVHPKTLAEVLNLVQLVAYRLQAGSSLFAVSALTLKMVRKYYVLREAWWLMLPPARAVRQPEGQRYQDVALKAGCTLQPLKHFFAVPGTAAESVLIVRCFQKG